jgi:hypothetical protein
VISPLPILNLPRHTDAEDSVSGSPGSTDFSGRGSGPVSGPVTLRRVDSILAVTPRPQHLFRSSVCTDPSQLPTSLSIFRASFSQPQSRPDLSPGNFRIIEEKLRQLKGRYTQIDQAIFQYPLKYQPLHIVSSHGQARSLQAQFASPSSSSVGSLSLDPVTVPEPSRPDVDRCLGCHVWDKVCIRNEDGRRVLTGTGQPWCVECRRKNMSRCFPVTSEDRARLDRRCAPCVAEHTAGYDCSPTHIRPCPRCQQSNTSSACTNRR